MTTRSGLASAVAVNVAAGTLFSWSILPPAVGADLGRSADELGIVFSTALLVFALAVLLGGAPVDRHGPRRATVVAGLLSGGGLALAAAAPAAAVLHVGYGLLFGLGSGLAYLSAVSWVSTRGPGGRTWQIAVVVAAYAAGPVVAAPLGTAGIDLWGWRPTLVVAAVGVCGASLVASRGLPGPLPPVPTGRPGGAAVDESYRGVGVGDGAALVALWLLFLGAAVPGLLAFAFAAQVATERGVPVEAAGVVVAVTAAGNLLGRLLPAPLTTRSGLLAAMWAGQAALLLAVGTLAWSSSAAWVVVGLPLLALVYGMVSSLLPAATRLVTPDVRFGAAYGRVFSSFGVAAVVGPATGATLHEDADGFARGFEASLAGVAVSVVAVSVYQWRLRTATRPSSASLDVRRSGGAAS